MEVRIPFPGFYNTNYDGDINHALDSEAEYIMSGEAEVISDEIELSDIGEILFKYSNFSVMYQQIAVAYTSAFADFISEKVDFPVEVKFKEMTSPKEYNFETDSIFADISVEDLQKIREFVGEEALKEKAREMFTSRSGFISFYSNNVESWGEIEEWDHNQCFCLLSCLIVDDKWNDDSMDIYTGLQERISNIYSENVDWPAVEWELENFGVETDLEFPGPGITDTKQYVKKFDELNNLVGG